MSKIQFIYFLSNSHCTIKNAAPIILHGEGTFAMSAVKEIRVTEDYLGLEEETRKCQNQESFEECTTREYIEMVTKDCNCVPYGLNTFFAENQEYF